MADLNQQEVQQLMQSFAQLSNSFQHGQRGVSDYADAQRQAANEIQSSFNSAAQQIRGAAIDYTKAMFSATEGTGKYAGAVSAAGNAAWEIGKNFGILGIAAGGLIKIFGDVAAASLKQNDALMRAYREFADVGDINGTFDSVISNLNRIGLTTEQADQFKKVLEQVNPSLTAFGGGVTVGLKKYVAAMEGMIGVNNQTEIRMGKLGYSVQAMRESVASYMVLQSKLGLGQTATVDSIQKGSEKYMITLRELQEITGMTRDQAAKAMEQQMANFNWAQHMQDVQKNSGEEGVNKSQELLASLKDMMGDQHLAGLIEILTNDGAAMTEAGATVNLASRNSVAEAQKQVLAGKMTVDQAVKFVADSIVENGEAHRNTIKAVGDATSSFTGGLRTLTGATKYANTLADSTKTVKDAMTADAHQMTKAQILEQQERAMRIAKDQAIYMTGDTVVSTLSGLNGILFQFGKMLARLIDVFGNTLGLKMPKGGFSSQFRDKDDSKTELKQTEKEKAELEAKLEALKNTSTQEGLLNELKKNQDAKIALSEERRKLEANVDRELGPDQNQLKQIQIFNKQEAQLEMQRKLLEEQKTQASDSRGNIDKNKLNEINKAKQLQLEKELAEKKQQSNKLKEELGGYAPFGSVSATKERGAATDWKTSNTGAPVDDIRMEARSKAQKAIADQGAGYDSGTKEGDASKAAAFNKINFKDKEENNAGGKPTGALLALAERFKGMGTITAMNDAYHQNRVDDKGNPVNSKHKIGKAFDIVFNEANTPNTAEEAAAFKEQFKDWGASNVRDEYFNDITDRTNGKHFHLEVAKMGGLFKGPESGYPVMLHGKNESVWNEKQMHALLEDVQKSSVDNYKQELMDQMGLNKTATNPIASAANSNNNDIIMSMIDVLTSKFDTLISISNQTKIIQDDLLTYTRS